MKRRKYSQISIYENIIHSMNMNKQNPIERNGKGLRSKIEGRDLEDPLVHDDNSDVETPPLENCEQRSNHAPVPQLSLLHHCLPLSGHSDHQRNSQSPKPPFSPQSTAWANQREREREREN
jgi:hypothetical protein